MKTELKVPEIGESITVVTIGKILKKNGDIVTVDEEVIEIETDKLNQVLYAPISGRVTFFVKEGDVIKIGDLVATFDPVVQEEGKSEKNTLVPTQEVIKPEAVAVKPVELPKEKIEPTISTAYERSETRKKMSTVRQAIAKRLVESTQNSAMLTTFNEIDMSSVINVREKYKESFQKKFGVKLGFMSFFVKAATEALQAFPIVNAAIDGNEIVYHNYIDIGVAVSTERGVIVPVLRDCQLLSYDTIEKEIEQCAARARDGQVTLEELIGGTFTITNGGVFGSLLSTPILNPPQSAILGMHKIEKRPIVVDDQIAIRPMMYVALSYDHRILDGKEAVLFLMHIKNTLEDPQRSILHL